MLGMTMKTDIHKAMHIGESIARVPCRSRTRTIQYNRDVFSYRTDKFICKLNATNTIRINSNGSNPAAPKKGKKCEKEWKFGGIATVAERFARIVCAGECERNVRLNSIGNDKKRISWLHF